MIITTNIESQLKILIENQIKASDPKLGKNILIESINRELDLYFENLSHEEFIATHTDEEINSIIESGK